MRIQYHMLSWNGNPLVDVRTGARHADGRLCGLCTGGVARKLEAEASRGALQRAIASWNGNPLVDVRTGARHADGRLGGLWSRHVLKRINAACGRGGFIQN